MTIQQEILAPLLDTVIERGASDLALVPDSKPYLMIGGRIEVLVDTEPISARTLNAILEDIVGADAWHGFLDAAATAPLSVGRAALEHRTPGFRLVVSADADSRVAASFRNLSGANTPAPEPTGPLGSGKISSLETITLPEILAARATDPKH